MEYMENPEEVKNLRKRIWCRNGLAGFLLLMLLFTILSRIVDARQTPKVLTAYQGSASVTKTVSGNGSVEAGEVKSMVPISGLRIEAVHAPAGTAVKEGDVLFSYNQESLQKKEAELLKEIKKQELAIEQERRGAETYQGTSQTEIAQQNLLITQRKVEQQNHKLAEAEQAYHDNLASLKDYYDKRVRLSRKELIETTRDDYEQSRTDYRSLRQDRDKDLNAIQRSIRDVEKKIEKQEAKEEPDEDLLEELQEELERLEEDLQAADENWDLRVDRARDVMNDRSDIYDRAGKALDSARLALKESYENAVKQEEATLQSERELTEQTILDLQTAAWGVENAGKNDRAEGQTREQTKELARLRIEGLTLELNTLMEEHERIAALIAAQGEVKAPYEGTVSLNELEQGKELAGTERLLLSTGLLSFHGSFDRKEGGTLEVGDELQVRLEGREQPISATTKLVDLVTDADTGSVTADLEPGTASLGQKASFEMKRNSALYNTVIPSSALRKDSNGWYCLVLRSHKTIMGEEFRAFRVDLNLLEAGDSQAAVEGALTKDEPVITGSDRVFGAGDRVRPVESLQ